MSVTKIKTHARRCWRAEDAIGFEAGDANLFRYAGNEPADIVDPSGLDFVLKDNKLTLSAQFEVEWADADQWTEGDKRKFLDKFKAQVESVWNNSPFLLVSKDGNTKYIPQVKISFVTEYTNQDHTYKLSVSKQQMAGGTLASTSEGMIAVSASDAFLPTEYPFKPDKDAKPITIEGSIPAHEFGHVIGLSHPGGFAQDPEKLIPVYSEATPGIEGGASKGPNSPAAYEADVFCLMERGTELRYWMFSAWVRYLDKNQAGDKPWTVEADEQDPKYKEYYSHWEKYCKDRLTPLAKPALQQLTDFVGHP